MEESGEKCYRHLLNNAINGKQGRISKKKVQLEFKQGLLNSIAHLDCKKRINHHILKKNNFISFSTVIFPNSFKENLHSRYECERVY